MWVEYISAPLCLSYWVIPLCLLRLVKQVDPWDSPGPDSLGLRSGHEPTFYQASLAIPTLVALDHIRPSQIPVGLRDTFAPFFYMRDRVFPIGCGVSLGTCSDIDGFCQFCSSLFQQYRPTQLHTQTHLHIRIHPLGKLLFLTLVALRLASYGTTIRALASRHIIQLRWIRAKQWKPEQRGGGWECMRALGSKPPGLALIQLFCLSVNHRPHTSTLSLTPYSFGFLSLEPERILTSPMLSILISKIGITYQLGFLSWEFLLESP